MGLLLPWHLQARLSSHVLSLSLRLSLAKPLPPWPVIRPHPVPLCIAFPCVLSPHLDCKLLLGMDRPDSSSFHQISVPGLVHAVPIQMDCLELFSLRLSLDRKTGGSPAAVDGFSVFWEGNRQWWHRDVDCTPAGGWRLIEAGVHPRWREK